MWPFILVTIILIIVTLRAIHHVSHMRKGYENCKKCEALPVMQHAITMRNVLLYICIFFCWVMDFKFDGTDTSASLTEK